MTLFFTLFFEVVIALVVGLVLSGFVWLMIGGRHILGTPSLA